jgi:hypothetical protein
MQLRIKKRQLIAILPITLFILLTFIIPVTFAQAPTSYNGGSGGNIYDSTLTEVCVNVAISTITSCNAIITGINTEVGDLITVYTACSQTYEAYKPLEIEPPSDTAGNLYVNTVGIGDQLEPYNPENTTVDWQSEGAYALSALSVATGNVTIQIKTSIDSTTLIGCLLYIEDDSVHVSQFLGTPQTNPDTTELTPPFNFTIGGPFCQLKNACTPTMFLVSYTTGGYNNTAYATSPNIKPIFPLATTYPENWFPTLGLSMYASQAYVPNANGNLNVSVTISCPTPTSIYVYEPSFGCSSLLEGGHAPCCVYYPQFWEFGSINLAFSIGSVTSNCYSVQSTITGIKNESATTTLLANTPYMNWFTYNDTSVVYTTKIQVDIASVTSSEPSIVTLALFEAPYQPFLQNYINYQSTNNSLWIGGNLNALLMPYQYETWSLAYDTSPQNLTLDTQFSVPPTVVALLVLTSSTNEVTVYNSTAPNEPTLTDTYDGIASGPQYSTYAGYEVLPWSINHVNFNQANLNLFAQYVILCNSTIGQTAPTKVFSTLIIPANCTSLQGSSLLYSLINYWPIWIIPLIMSGLFGMIGLFIGLITGMAVGTATGIVPIYADIMMFLGVALIMVRREI